MRNATTVLALFSVLLAVAPAARGDDKAAVSWHEFADRSDFVFAGLLTMAELLDGGAVRCTYRVNETFKGDAVRDVTFDMPADDRANTEVGTLAVVALRREGDDWVLSVDSRSCWKHQNRMRPDFGGFPVYEVPAALILDLPPALREDVELLAPDGDGGYRARTESVFPTATVGRELGGALRGGAAAGAAAGGEDRVAVEVQRLASPHQDEAAAAVIELTRIGGPAAPALVEALANPRDEVRGCAAEALRSVLAAGPEATGDDVGRARWEERIVQIKEGMKLGDAVKVLLPDATDAERAGAAGPSSGSGGGGAATYRVDDYWVVTLYFVGFDDPKIGAAAPALSRSVRYVWVAPPGGYTGLWTTYYVNGQPSHEIQFRDGQYDGTFTSFSDAGRKTVRQHYVAGVCHGTDTGYHASGAKSYEGEYRNGKQVGTWRWWSEDGQIINTQEYCDASAGAGAGAADPPATR